MDLHVDGDNKEGKVEKRLIPLVSQTCRGWFEFGGVGDDDRQEVELQPEKLMKKINECM